MRKTFYITLIFTLLVNLATASTQLEIDFCHTAESALCNRETDEQKNKKFERLKKEIADEARINALKRYENELPTTGLFLNLRKNIKKTKILNQEIIFSAEKKLGYFEKDIITESNIELIKKYLNQSIDASNLENKYKAKFKKILNSEIIVGNYIDFMERTKVTSSYFKQLWRAHCGMDGMSVNAFAALVDWKKYVLVCPGLLVQLNSLKNSKELNNEIFFVLAHEMAHHFDSGTFRKAYEKMAKCYQKSVATNLNKKNGKKCPLDDTICRNKLTTRSVDTQKKCSSRKSKIHSRACSFLRGHWNKLLFNRCKKGTGDECLKSVTWAHLGELSADYWATKAIGHYMSERNFEKTEGVEFLRVNFEILCNSGDEGIHADGKFRGDYMIGNNPEIREQLTCEPSRKSYCEI